MKYDSFTKEKLKKPRKRDRIKILQFAFKGVTLTANGKKFRAVIYVKGRRLNLGEFNTEKQAIKAYNNARKKYVRIFNEK